MSRQAAGCLLLVALALVWPFVGGALLMEFTSVVHGEWPAVPGFGYWPCVSLVLLLSIAGAVSGLAKGIQAATK